MPDIRLKPNSAEFLEEIDHKKTDTILCDMPGCDNCGEYKAPKDRSLNTYFQFCLLHVQEYNKAWDYFSGMSRIEIEDHIIRSQFWDRPTWKFTNYADLERELYRKAWHTWQGHGANEGGFENIRENPEEENWQETREERMQREAYIKKHAPEFEAMVIMGLEPPLELEEIKKRYKELVKKYHPDINRDDPDAEELLKKINMAYTILKLSYDKYQKLEEK